MQNSFKKAINNNNNNLKETPKIISKKKNYFNKGKFPINKNFKQK